MSLIAHYLHKWKIRLLILIALALLWPIQALVINSLQSDALTPYPIKIPANLTSEIRQNWQIPPNAQIDRVFISGGFNDWNTNESFYQMSAVDGFWQYQLPVYPGDIEYKLVIYLKNISEPVWILDPQNPATSTNPWGGENSVLHISDWPKIAFTSQVLTLALAGTFLLFCLLEPLLYWLLHQKLPFYKKLVVSNILILACAQMLFFSYQLHLNRQLIKQGLIDNVHTMHLILSGNNINFNNLSNQQQNLDSTLAQFFVPATTRVDKTQSSLFQITLSDFAVLDPHGELITLKHRTQNQHLQQTRANNLGFKNTNDYFMKGIWRDLLPKALNFPLNGQIVIGSRPYNISQVETARTQTAELVLGFSQFIQPIVYRGQLKGFYAGSIQVKLYGDELLRMLFFQLLLFAGVIILSSWLYTRVGKLVTSDILKLNRWTKDIVGGNLTKVLNINSQDEIQQLSENFNKMRISLQDSFSQIEQQNTKLYQEAYFNSLTELPNRKKLYSDLATSHITALLVLNINDFGEFNDFFGVSAGDEILIELTKRLNSSSLPLTLYKTGPDEFTAIVESQENSINEAKLTQLAQQIVDMIGQQAFIIEGSEYYISISIGGALLPNEASKPQQKHIDQLHLQADLARRVAKKQRLKFCIFQPQMANSEAFKDNMRLSQMLAQAANEQWVTPYVQLIAPLTGGAIKFECLMRITLPNKVVLAPAQFMQAARHSRLYSQLMRTMLQKSIQLFKDQPYEFAVNITLDDIAIPQNLNAILALLKQEPDTCKRLNFELLESEEITNYDAVEQFIKLVKPYGCKIAIDDFGSGYSNFVHLLSLDIDIIKIDGSLIKHLDSDPKAQLLVETVASFSQKMAITTVAEFVENESILALLNQYNIDYAQGYLLGKPEPSIAQALECYLPQLATAKTIDTSTH
ncbi:EAL domain-containing protein [Shewanella gaetbuli]